jgi:integrase
MAYLTLESIQEGRVVYKRRKTHASLSLKLENLSNDIFKNYEARASKYLIPVLPADVIEDSLHAKKLLYQWIKTTNKWLREIAKDCKISADITTYVTRHTWATLAKKKGYSNELIAEGLGHQYGNKITNIYLDNFDQCLIDEVNRQVLDLVTCQ